MDDLKVEHLPLNVIPVTEYDPFEAKFAASLYWLVFCATEDGEFENIPSQVTSPIQRDCEKRITVRPEVIEFLTNGEIYCKVCDSIFRGKVPVVGQWAIIQTLSRHGFYVVEEGDIAVTDSALQQRKPFRKSTHLALMDCLMSAFSAQAVSVQQVVQSVSKFSSFNASKELPFDLEDALLLWINKICAALNDNQLKKQKQHAEQLLQNQDKAKRFRFRRDQLQPKVQTEFPVMEDLLKDISDGQSLLGIVMFYHPTVVSLEDIRFDKNLSTEDCVHNLDLFRSLCSQFICTSVLALKLEDLLYGSQAMKPNVIALLAEIFNKCKVESTSPENGVNEKTTSKSDVDLQYIVANKENVMDNRSSSAPVLNSDKNKGIEHESPREMYKGKNERFSYISGQLRSSSSDRIEQINSSVWKSQSDSQMNSNSRLSFKSPFQLDFTVDDDIQQPLNGPLSTQDVHEKEKENPFSGIFQRPVLAGDRKRSTPNMLGAGGSPRATPRQEHSLLMRRNKQKQRTLDLEEWDMQQEELEDLQLNDIQRSQSLTGLDKAKVEPRQSFHAWREDTGASLSDTNLASSRNEKISLDFRPKLPTSAPQRGTEGSIPQRGAEGIPFVPSGLKAKCEEHSSHDSLSSTDSLNMAPSGDKLRDSLLLGVRDSCMSDISTKELNQFEEIEAQILAGKSVETPRTFVKSKNKLSKAPIPQEDEDELNTSVNSEDMDMFRLEVLQRLTEDKLQQIPDGAEMEDDDPILLARSNAASGSNPSDERARLEVPDAPADDPTDQLSPITETSEPVVSNPNSVSSANSTAPSSPCSPLDVAPFMPEFFTTSPANSLDRKSKRFSMKTREDSDATLVGEDDDEFTCEPVTSVTPRFQTKSGDKNGLFPVKSKSFEQLARGSYTVSHVSEDSAKAAGIPVIGTDGPVTEPGFPVESGVPVTEAGTSVFSTEARGRTESVTSTSAHQELSKVSQNSRDLSGFRPLILSSDGVELIGGANEGVDGRRDSLETSPAHSPAFTRGKRVDAHQEAVLQSRGMTTQDSPSDVVIFERSLSNPLEGRTPLDASCAETRENAQYNPGTVTRSSKSEAYVFDFNQDTVEHYKNGHKTQDFRTYKKSQLSGQAQNEVPQGDQRAASVNEDTAEQRFQGAQKDAHIGTYSKNSHSDEREQSAADSLDGRHRQRISEEARGSVVSVKDLRQSDGFSTFRKDSTSELKNFAVVSSAHALDLRRSDGFTTFRKQVKQVSDAALERQRFSMASTHDQRSSEADRFSTFAKSAKKQSDAQNYAKEGLRHFHETTSSGRADLQQATMTARAPSSVGGESDRQTSPRGVEEEQIRPSGSPNLTRSRTFRKTPDGQIIDDRSSVGNNEDNSSASRDSRLPGRNVIATNRVSSPGTVVTLTDDTEVRVRLTRQVDASADRSESSPTNSPRRPSSPRQTGRGSPVETITWVDSAKSLTDRVKQPRCMCGKRDACADRTTAQDSNPTSSPRRRSSPRQTGRGIPVETITWGDSAKSLVLNNRGCMQEDTRTELFADELSGHERPHFIATEVIHQRVLHQNEASPWQQGGTEHSRLCAAPRVFPSSHNEEQTPVMTSGLLLNGNTSTAVDNELKPRETRVDASSPTSEPDTRGGGSIRDRIAALTAAAGVSRLDVSPGREQSRVDITPGKEQSRMDITPGKEQSRVDVTPGKEQSRMDITPGGEQSRLDVTPGKEQSRVDVTPGSEQSTVTAEKGVAFDVEFQKAPKPRPPPRVTSRFSTKDLDRKDVTVCETWVVNNRELEAVNNREFEAVNNKDLGVVRDKSVAFEVSFDDEPQSKRSKDETGLLQSPFKAFRTRSNRRHQYQSSVKLRLQRTNMGEGSLICMQNDDCKENGSISTFSSDAGLVQKATSDQLSVDITSSKRATPQEDVKDRSNSKVSNLEKRNTFTLDLVSQFTENTSGQGLPVVEVFDKLVSKEESKTVNEQQQGSNSGLPKLHKRNTFTLDLDSEYTGDASKQGLSIAKALNELANKEEFNNPKENYLPSEHLQKRNTFTLDSASGEGVDIAAVLNDLASEEEMKQNKQLSVVPDGPTQKRGTFTLDSVSQSIQSASMEGVQVATVLNDLASKEELKQNKQQSDVDISSETSQKRSTFTLDCVSRDIDSAIEKYFPNECANFTSEDSTRAEKQDASEKRSTYTLDLVSLSLQSGVNEGLPVEEVLCQLATHEELQSSRLSSAEESAPKRGTFTFDSVSQTLEDAEKKGLSASEVLSHLAKQEEFESSSESVVEESAPKRETITFDSVSQTLEDAEEKGLSASEVLSQLAKQEELESTSESAVEESVQKRGTFALDSVSQTLKEAQCNGLPALEAPHQLASEGERHSLTDTHPSLSNPPQNRGTYTLDTVSHAIQEAVEKGIPVSVTLNHLAQEEKSQRHSHAHDCNDATASEFAQGLRRPDTRALSPEARDEFEASFEDALEQLEDCVTWDNGEAFPTSTTCERPSSEAPGNRGTFDLDNVSTSLQDGAPVVETLERLSRTSGLPKDGIANNQTSQAKRGTYTLDEVSRSLQIASEQGIPVVDVLQHLTRVKEPSSESEEIKQGVGKRGTYTLNEVSKSLEHAEESGIPVIDALEALSKDKPKSTLRLKIPERGTDHRETYTLDKVSHSLEHATQKGLPVVDALGQLTASKESPVHRRQVKLINRKTYALASPLETIGEGAKLRLYDGSKKQMMSPISFHLKTKEAIASKPSGNDSKARGVVQKLDFLTSACELLLEANAKEMVRDPQGTESTPNNPTSDESVQGSHRAPSQAFVSQPDRNTYSLESVSSTIDDAKAKGIPVVETLSNVTSDVNPNATQRTNHMRLNSKSDSELINEESGKESENRYTHSLENVSRTLEDAKKAGIPVIQALDQLTNELAEFSLTAMSGNFPITQSGKDNRKRKRYSETAINGEIDALQQDDADDDPVLAAKLANLRVQLAEKRRQIEAMKSRRTVEQEDQHRKMMDTLYGHVINKARGGQTVGEGPASEVLDSRKPVTEFPDQPTPPIAWSSPANSPLPASASHPSSNGQQFETREFRLSEYPPGNDLATKQDMTRPTSQPAFELSSRPTPVPPRPSSHDPAGSRHTAPVRKCWDVDLGQIATPPPLIRPGTASVNMATKQETVSPEGGDAAEIEVENLSPLKKGLAMFIGDDESQGLTPEQEKKREKFMRLRQKKQEEDRTRKEAELERKRKRNEKQHEKVMLQKMEEQRLRREEVEQRRAEQELRIRKTEAARVPDSYATYRRQGPRPQVYDVSNDVNSHFVPSPAQSSGFAEFSGPQCYVKPSGKSNRKIIVNAISHVCLSGTVNQDQKEKCLQAISESDGHHFMILFKDGLKFRGIYVHNLDNDQLYKVFGIGPRVVTSKMFEFIYKYNSGAKEFTKIPSKTISISVDGFAIQKSCWSTGKPVVPSKTASNFKKPPRPPQR